MVFNSRIVPLFTLRYKYSTLCNIHCTLYSRGCFKYSTLCNIHCTLYSMGCFKYSTLCNIHCTLYSTLCNIHCTLYSTLCNIHCTLYSRGCSNFCIFCGRSYRFPIYQGHCCKVSAKNNDRYPPANAILCPHLNNSTSKLCSNTWLSPTRFLKLNDCFKLFFCKSKKLLRYIDFSILF